MVRTKAMRRYAQDEVNQEESEQNEVDGMKKGADSTGKVMQRLVMWCCVAYTDAVDCQTTCVPSSKTEWKISNNKTKNDVNWLFTWWLDRTVIRWSACPVGVYGTPMKTPWLLPLTATTLCSLSASCSGSAANYLAKQTIVPGCTHVITAIHIDHWYTRRYCQYTYDLTLWRTLLPYEYSYKAPCGRGGHAVICNFWHPGTLSVRVPGCQKLQYKWRLNPVCHRMLYSCTPMATVRGVKGLTCTDQHGLYGAHHSQTRRTTFVLLLGKKRCSLRRTFRDKTQSHGVMPPSFAECTNQLILDIDLHKAEYRPSL